LNKIVEAIFEMAEIIIEKPWSFTLYDKDGEWILTLLIGGVVDVPVSIVLTPEEIERVKLEPRAVEDLVELVRKDRSAFASRELKPVFRG
jgi:hypothetical protein